MSLRSLLRALFGFGRPRRRRRSIFSSTYIPPARRETAVIRPATRPSVRVQSRSVDITVVTLREIIGRVSVIDGDTIIIQGTRIRLAGIDAPELEDPYGPAAKWAMARLCKGQVVRAVTDGEQSYERLVATCYLPDGRDLSAELVKLGLALDWRSFSRGKYRDLEPEGIRQKLWRVTQRQGRRPPDQVLPD